MPKSTLERLEDIINIINTIKAQLDGMGYDTFVGLAENNKTLYYAICHEYQIIGEAVKDLPEVFKSENDQIFWRGFVGMRNVIVHQYSDVELDPMWKCYSDGELDELFSVVTEEINRIKNKV